MKDSLNSIMLYNFWKFHTYDFIKSYNNLFSSLIPILPLLPLLSPQVTLIGYLFL